MWVPACPLIPVKSETTTRLKKAGSRMTLDSRSLLSYVDRGLVLNFTRAPPQASLKVLQTQLGGLAVD